MPTHYQGTPQEINALNTYIKMTRAVDSFMNRLNQHRTLGDLTLSQFGVLEALYHLGPMSQNEIGAKILKSSGNMTMVIDNLEKGGLAIRTRNMEDRRVITVSLTPAGRQLIEQVLPKHVQAITEEMSVLNEKEQEKLAELCRKLGSKEHQRLRTE